MLTKWLRRVTYYVTNYKTTWPYLVLTALVVAVSATVGFAIGYCALGFMVFAIGRLVPVSGNLAGAVGLAIGVIVAVVLGFALYRFGQPFARKYAPSAAERAAEAAEQSTAQGVTPIGHTTDGQPIYPVVGYTPDGQPVTADRAIGVRPQTAGTNGLAIAAFVCSLLVAPVGLILGIVARSQIKRTGQRGSGLAIAGIIIGGLFTLLNVVAIVALYAASHP